MYDQAMPTGQSLAPLYGVRAVHDIAEVKSINTNPLVMVADRAAIDARNNTPASLLKA